MGRTAVNIKPSEVMIPVTVRLPLNYRNHLRKVAADKETTFTGLIVEAVTAKYPAPAKK